MKFSTSLFSLLLATAHLVQADYEFRLSFRSYDILTSAISLKGNASGTTVDTYIGPARSTPFESVVGAVMLVWQNPCVGQNIDLAISQMNFSSYPPYISKNGFVLVIDLERTEVSACPMTTKLRNIATSVTSKNVVAVILKHLAHRFDNDYSENVLRSNLFADTQYNIPTFRLVEDDFFSSFGKENIAYIWERASPAFEFNLTSASIQYLTLDVELLQPSPSSAMYYTITQWIIPFLFGAFLIYAWHRHVQRRRSNASENRIPLQTVTPPKPLIVLTEADVAKIPIVKYSEVEKEDTPKAGDESDPEFNTHTACSVCLEQFRPDDEVRLLLGCKHPFHRTCIDEWLLNRATNCPNCRLDTRIALKIHTGITMEEDQSIADETSNLASTSREENHQTSNFTGSSPETSLPSTSSQR